MAILNGIATDGIYLGGFDGNGGNSYVFGNNIIGYVDENDFFILRSNSYSATSAYESAGFSPSGTRGYAVTSSGEVVGSTDNGLTWSYLSQIPGLGVGATIRSMWVISDSIILVGGKETTSSDQTIWRSTNNGATWSIVYQDATSSAPIEGFSFLDSNLGYAVAIDTAFKTTDGGANWTPIGATLFADDISMATGAIGWCAREAGGSNTVFKTTDSGATFGTQAVATTTKSVFAVDTLTAYASGENGQVFKTSNGTTWSTQTPGGASTLLYSLHFKDDGSFGIVGGQNSEIYTTKDGGNNWKSVINVPTGNTWYKVWTRP